MKRKPFFILTLLLVLVLLCACDASTTDGNGEHPHSYTIKNVDDRYLKSAASPTAPATYYYSCACGEKGETTFTVGAPLPNGQEGGAAHTHVYDRESTEDRYLKSKATCTVPSKYYYSCACGEKGSDVFSYGEAGHNYSDEWTTDDTNHRYECQNEGCTEVKDEGAHIFGEWITDTPATCQTSGSRHRACTVCGKSVSEPIEDPSAHNFASVWDTDDTHHFYACKNEGCTETRDKAEHSFGADKHCVTCRMEYYTQGLVFAFKNGSYSVTDFTGSANEVYIPTTYKGLPVTIIGYNAFDGYTALTAITIPDGVTEICSGAFKNCKNLSSLIIPDSVSRIGYAAFEGCAALTSITLPFVGATVGGTEDTHFGYIFGAFSYSSQSYSLPQSLKTVVVTGNESIDSYAFSDCSDLTSITLSGGITSIGDYAFRNCTGLPAFTIPTGVTKIGYGAFMNCKGLSSLTIPQSVTSIGSDAFYGCYGLTSMTLPFVGATKGGTENTHFGYIFGADTYQYNTIVPSALKTVIITGDSNIGDYAFYKCDELTSIILRGDVKHIGSYAFAHCWRLPSLTLPSTVTSIGDYAFDSCDFTSITIPEGVTRIGDYAFRSCGDLKSVTLGKHITSIGNYAFFDCKKLTGIDLGESLTSIGDYAFSGCTSLSAVTLPESLKSIGVYAFEKCEKLTSVVVPKGVTSIGAAAFQKCEGITSITLPFIGTTSGDTSYTYFASVFGLTSPPSDYYVPDLLQTVIITGDVHVDASAFNDCRGLTTVVLEGSVTEIGENAFRSCSKLTSITIGDGLVSIGNRAFQHCRLLTAIHFEGTTEKWLSLVKGTDWDTNTGSYTVYCTNGTLTK